MTFEKVEIGDATLYRGDCMEVLPLIGAIDAMITDPPYGIGYAANPIVGKGKKASNHERKEWDDDVPVLDELLKRAPVSIIWGGNYFALPPSRGWLTWYKPDAPPSMAHFEMAWTSLDKNARQISRSIAATNSERVGHPTQKPLGVMTASIEYAGDVQVIFDPFMGSGTTGVAAIQLGRKFIGIERDERYFDIACARIEQAVAQGQLFAPAPRKQEQTDIFAEAP